MTEREVGADDDDETPPAWLPGLLELDRERGGMGDDSVTFPCKVEVFDECDTCALCFYLEQRAVTDALLARLWALLDPDLEGRRTARRRVAFALIDGICNERGIEGSCADDSLYRVDREAVKTAAESDDPSDKKIEEHVAQLVGDARRLLKLNWSERD